MKRSSYGERDYAFGQAMLTLRTALGLTQAGLAEFLGVSRKAVGGWESGGSYPKAEHLKAVLTLAVQQGTFPAGREEEEMRAFWKAAHQVAAHFEVVIWRSLRDAPSCEALLDDCLQVLAPQPLSLLPADCERRISRLLEHLREQRVLLVLDNLESLLEEGEVRGHLRPGYEGYARLLRRVAETAHQSCLLLTSREKPTELRALEGSRSPVRSLRR